MLNSADNKEAASKEHSSNTFRFAVLAGAVYWWSGLTDQAANAVSQLGSILPKESIITQLLISFGLGYATAYVLKKKKSSVRALFNNDKLKGSSPSSEQTVDKTETNKTLVYRKPCKSVPTVANVEPGPSPSPSIRPLNAKLKLQ